MFFFFFKQKTAYEIRPCDWSSDVCSSDLAARVAHMDPLDVGPAAEATDQMGIETGGEPSGASRRRQEIHVTRLPARAPERLPRRRLAELERAAPKPRLHRVHALVRAERGGIDIEVAPLDFAPAEKAAASRVAVPCERQQFGLRKAMRRRRGRDGGDARGRHSTLPSSTLRVRWKHSEHTARVQTMPLFSFEGRRPRVHPSAFVAPTAVLVGDVTVEENASVWYNAVLRADFNPIIVRRGANVQD